MAACFFGFVMKRNIIFCSLFLTVLFLNPVFAAKEKAPDWIADVHSVYKSKDYIAEMGTGATKELAQLDALGLLSSYFDTQIKKSASSSTAIESFNDESIVKESALVNIDVKSDVELFAVQYEFYFLKKTKEYYCVAYINRNDAWAAIRLKTDAEERAFVFAYKNALSQEANPIYAIKDYGIAYTHLRNLKNYMVYASLIVPQHANFYDDSMLQGSTIPGKVNRLRRNTTVSLVVNNDIQNKVRVALKDLLSNEGYTIKDGGNGTYKVNANVNLNMSYIDEIYTSVPSIDISIEQGSELIFSYSKNFEKLKTMTKERITSKASEFIVNELNKSFLKEFHDNL